MGQTIAESIWEEGILKGRTEGELAASRRMLRRFLTARFGQLPDAVVQRIENCADVDRFTAAAKQAPGLDRPEDLQL
jgi:hypothetical protein